MQRRSINSKGGVELFQILQKERLFWSLIRASCSSRYHQVPSFSPNPPSEKQLYPLSVWSSREFTWTVIWKKSFLVCFESYWVSLIPTGKVHNTLLMVNTTYPHVSEILYMINICCLLFILCKERNRSLVCISSKQRILWRWTHNFYVDKFTKKKKKKNTRW